MHWHNSAWAWEFSNETRQKRIVFTRLLVFLHASHIFKSTRANHTYWKIPEINNDKLTASQWISLHSTLLIMWPKVRKNRWESSQDGNRTPTAQESWRRQISDKLVYRSRSSSSLSSRVRCSINLALKKTRTVAFDDKLLKSVVWGQQIHETDMSYHLIIK